MQTKVVFFFQISAIMLAFSFEYFPKYPPHPLPLPSDDWIYIKVIYPKPVIRTHA